MEESKKIVVIKTPMYPKSFTVSEDGEMALDNGNFSWWFETRKEAQELADKMNTKDKGLRVRIPPRLPIF